MLSPFYRCGNRGRERTCPREQCKWQSWAKRPGSLVSEPELLILALNHSCEAGSSGCKPNSCLFPRLREQMADYFSSRRWLSAILWAQWGQHGALAGLGLAVSFQGQLCLLWTSSVTSLWSCFSFVNWETESLFMGDFAGSSAFSTNLGTGAAGTQYTWDSLLPRMWHQCN